MKCPNCKTESSVSICENCGYILQTKCSKCGKSISTDLEKCACGFSVKSTLAYNECENDDFASVVVSFDSLRVIRKMLDSQELFAKFYFKLKNLLMLQLSGLDVHTVIYNDVFVINFNKELSLQTSANKAARLALKIIGTFTNLNLNLIEQLGTSLKLNIAILKKDAVELLDKKTINHSVKLLSVKKNDKKYLKDMQIILDENIEDCICKEFKTDSLFSCSNNNKSDIYYEIVLDKYISPPDETLSNDIIEITRKKNNPAPTAVLTKKTVESITKPNINAKCKFEKTNAAAFFDKYKDNKIISIRSRENLKIDSSKLVQFFESKGLKVLRTVCTQELNYKPWGVLGALFIDYYNLSNHKDFISQESEANCFQNLFELVNSKPIKASSPEDARFAYMDDFVTFLTHLKNCVIIIEDFEYVDDTTLQTLELYFDKFKKVNSQFVFISNEEIALHAKFKGLLRTPLYTEYLISETGMELILSKVKEEASDFIQSNYFEQIKNNFAGSFLYYENAIKFLQEKGILKSVNNKLVVDDTKPAGLPETLHGILKARLKALSKNMDASILLAYSVYLGERLDCRILQKLGITNLKKTINILETKGFISQKNDYIYIENFNLVKPVIEEYLKQEVNEFLAKNILAKIGKGLDETTKFLIMGKLALFKEEYLLLWKNSQFSMSVGDFDAYLKNCLGFLSLVEHIKNNISEKEIENNKKEVYQNILMNLYNYAPEKIYDIENILLTDALDNNDDNKILKLSNLMLQGALISSNYTDAPKLLHNILSRTENPTLLVNGAINTKYLLLSLINVEILYNTGEFAQCKDVAKDLLAVLQPEIINRIKPASFSLNLFIEHLFDSLRLAAFAKTILMDEDINTFFDSIKEAIGVEHPDRECFISLREFLDGKRFAVSNAEFATPFAKVIYLILQEIEEHGNDYKTLAQNIYQAKLLAADIRQSQMEKFCELLIAYAYSNLGMQEKSQFIYEDILTKSKNSSTYPITLITEYFIAGLYLKQAKHEEALVIIDNALENLKQRNNQATFISTLFEKLFAQVNT